jgi:HD-like signal output (HDOD) protein
MTEAIPTKVLLVDDEARVVEGLQRRLRPYRSWLRADVANGGPAALSMLEAGKYDVVVSDMRMPGMDGVALLGHVKETCPGVVRIALSGQTDLGARMRAVRTAHQFLAKPCEADVVVSTIEQARRAQLKVARADALAAIGGTAALPSIPEVYQELLRLLGDKSASASEIAALIERDLAMVAKVMQLVSSPFFVARPRAASVREAVESLGTTLLADLVRSHGIFEALDVEGHAGRFHGVLTRLQAEALFIAALARRIAPVDAQRDDAFTAGMLHDIGRLSWLSRMPESFEQIAETHETTGRAIDDIEREHCGFTHAELGGLLAGLWGYGGPIVEAIAFHHDASSKGACDALQIADIVYLAHELAHRSADGLPPGYLERLGVASKLEEWKLRAEELRRAT